MAEKASVWILGTQLLAEHPALAAAATEYGRENVTAVLIESRQRMAQRPYQRKKLVLLFSAMRHYAEALRRQGFEVDYRQATSFGRGLQEHVSSRQPDQLLTMAANDYPGRQFQQGPLAERVGRPVAVFPNSQFLVSEYNPYPKAGGDKRLLMEHFYRRMRRHFGVLMDDGEPVGGRWNFDKENRKPLPKGDRPPPIITFEPDEITQQVMAEVASLPGEIGTADGFNLATTYQQAQAAADDFFDRRLAAFGPYEDAMSSRGTYLYHSNLAAYLNIGLLEPMALIRAAQRAYHAGQAPINSVEGFIRQVLGWREYMYWQYWRFMPELYEGNFWQAQRPLPEFFWDGQTEMACLGHVIGRALDSGYSHHIERLMVISNFCLLTGIEPLAVNEWFLSAYVDAYDWVMGPNVMGMGLNADGGMIASKPYIASANYINKMSDYCAGCRYDRKARTCRDACPFNTLYWGFLLQHEERLRANPRLGPNVLSLRYLDEGERAAVGKHAAWLLANLDNL